MRIILPGILLVYSAVTDIKRREISGKALLIFGILGILCAVFGIKNTFWDTFFGVSTGILLVVISLLTKGELGMGDALLICVTGVYLGFVKNVQLLAIAMIMSGVFAIGMLIRCGKNKNIKLEFPFVPFITAAYTVMEAADIWWKGV